MILHVQGRRLQNSNPRGSFAKRGGSNRAGQPSRALLPAPPSWAMRPVMPFYLPVPLPSLIKPAAWKPLPSRAPDKM